MPNNCSVIGVHLKDDQKEQYGELKDVAFVWEFPYIEEDI